MKWNVTNALSRDVERQHLNKILAEIRAAIDSVQAEAKKPTDDVRAIVGSMVEGNSEQGLSVTYNVGSGVLDFAVNNFLISLTGDVTGQGTVSSLRNVSIPVTIDPSKIGIPEAPKDNNAYWRMNGAWDAVSTNLLTLSELSGMGFLSLGYDDVEAEPFWNIREFAAIAGELTVSNADGVDGNPTYGLADLTNTGVGSSPIQLFTRDSKGRVEGTESASTDDLPEGVANLYFTEERAYEATKDVLVAGANVTLTPDDIAGTITITSTGGGGGGGVATVTGGTGIDVDNTDASNPIVALSSTAQTAVAFASSLATLSPTDGDILEYDGTAGEWATTKAPRLLYLDGGNF